MQLTVYSTPHQPLDGSVHVFNAVHVRNKTMSRSGLSNSYYGGATVCAFDAHVFTGDSTPVMHTARCNEQHDGYNRRLGILSCVEKHLNQISPSEEKVEITGLCRHKDGWEVQVRVMERKPTSDVVWQRKQQDDDYKRLLDIATQSSGGVWSVFPRPKPEKRVWEPTSERDARGKIVWKPRAECVSLS